MCWADTVRSDGVVADDGSPVEVYLALPVEPDLSRVRSLLNGRVSVLDLGCGPGRHANPLAADGHRVVAVDDSEVMLDQIVGGEPVLSDIWGLRLGRRFDAVLALSHLINTPDPQRRSDLLRVCREHLADDGIVIVERYQPDWSPSASDGLIGDVAVRLGDVVRHDDGSFTAVVTYTVHGRTWRQSFTATTVDDDEMTSLAYANGLSVKGTVDGDQRWVVLEAMHNS